MKTWLASSRKQPVSWDASVAMQGAESSDAKGSGFKERLEDKLYLPVFIPSVLLLAYGLFVVWSASLSIPEASFIRQCFGALLGVAAAAYIWQYDFKHLEKATKALLIIDVVLMLLPRVPGLGIQAKGMTGWVAVPLIGLRFQPSELAKLVTILLMSSLCARYQGKISDLKEYVKVCAILCVPFFSILLQPDLGTGLIVLVIGASIIICSGAKRSWVILTLLLIVLGAVVIISMSLTPGLPHPLKPYQLSRLLVFVDKGQSPAQDGYNLAQAQIAVGSGGIFGKGIGNATQAGQGFLPEAHTDFVFALLSEEFGLVGALVLIGLYGWLIFSTIGLAQKIRDPFYKLVLVGIVGMWTFQVLENIGMCIGVMPITGIPLPFISFGSSSMITQLMAVGMVLSIWNHRDRRRVAFDRKHFR